MNCHDVRSRLDDYLEDALSPSARRQVEDHLAVCDACRSELSSIGALLDTAQDLQRRQLEPGRDLWPAIHRRIVDTRYVERRSWKARLGLARPRFVWQFAAAAVILILALGFGVPRLSRWSPFRDGARLMGGAAPVPEETSGPDATGQFAALDSEVSTARQQIYQAAAADSTTEGSWKTFDDNLRVLDRAIRESRAALAQDPDNPLLQKTILGAYQKQLDLLRWASRLVHEG